MNAEAPSTEPQAKDKDPGPIPRIEVERSGKCIKVYDTPAKLREDLLKGVVARTDKARTVTQKDVEAKTEPEWKTVEAFALANKELRGLYRPVWDYTLKYMWYGALAGFAIKALDTTLLIAQVDEHAFIAWLIVIGGVFASAKWGMVAIVPALIVPPMMGVRANLFITLIGTALVGFLFGAPSGAVAGTVVGHIKRSKAETAPDADPEGGRPYLLGIALPIAFLAAFVPLYLWLMEKGIEWLSK